jgi:hypothetical protein
MKTRLIFASLILSGIAGLLLNSACGGKKEAVNADAQAPTVVVAQIGGSNQHLAQQRVSHAERRCDLDAG